MKRIWYNYVGNKFSDGYMDFEMNCTLDIIIYKLGVNAIINKIDSLA